MTKKLLMAAAGVFALLSAAPAFAQQNVSIEISSSFVVTDGCIVGGGNNTGNIDFGEVQNPSGLATDVDGSTVTGDPITVSCNVSSTTASLQINAGQNDAAGVHRLRNLDAPGLPGEFIEYHVYSDPSRAPGSEFTIGNPLPINGGVITAGTPFEIPVYGRIFRANAAQAVAGNHTDRLQAIFSF